MAPQIRYREKYQYRSMASSARSRISTANSPIPVRRENEISRRRSIFGTAPESTLFAYRQNGGQYGGGMSTTFAELFAATPSESVATARAIKRNIRFMVQTPWIDLPEKQAIDGDTVTRGWASTLGVVRVYFGLVRLH